MPNPICFVTPLDRSINHLIEEYGIHEFLRGLTCVLTERSRARTGCSQLQAVTTPLAELADLCQDLV